MIEIVAKIEEICLFKPLLFREKKTVKFEDKDSGFFLLVINHDSSVFLEDSVQMGDDFFIEIYSIENEVLLSRFYNLSDIDVSDIYMYSLNQYILEILDSYLEKYKKEFRRGVEKLDNRLNVYKMDYI